LLLCRLDKWNQISRITTAGKDVETIPFIGRNRRLEYRDEGVAPITLTGLCQIRAQPVGTRDRDPLAAMVDFRIQHQIGLRLFMGPTGNLPAVDTVDVTLHRSKFERRIAACGASLSSDMWLQGDTGCGCATVGL
jgi:hypothetical protein